MTSLTRKQVADAAGVTIEAVRFYEREGVIADPPRTASGYRQYPADTVGRIRFIKKAQRLGFTLPEIKELLALQLSPRTTPADVRAQAQRKIQDIQTRIETLQQIKTTLEHLVHACQGQGPLSECPILEALARYDTILEGHTP